MPTGITTNVNCGLGKSKSKGQPGNLAHNRREFDPYNTDPNLAVNNIFFANRSLKETYQAAFGDSIDEYISTQKRKDRISYTRDNYFKYLFGADPNSVEANAVLMSNKRGKNSVKSFNEMVVQIGDCKEFGNFMRDEYDNFIDKNGNKVKWDKSSKKRLIQPILRHRKSQKLPRRKRKFCAPRTISLQTDCEKLKKNLGHFIRQKSIELVRIAFPEIEQEKLAIKIKKLDETARQDFFMHPDNDGKRY